MKLFALFISSFLLTRVAECQEDGDVRLANGTATKGRLEVFNSGVWGTVCLEPSARSPRGMAQAVCRQLGYYNYRQVDVVSELNIPQGSAPAILSNVYCPYSGNPRFASSQHILRCEYFFVHSCSHFYDVAIECTTESLYSYPYDTMVRLMDDDEMAPSTSLSSGFVEIYLNKAWGPMCNLGIDDADSVCRQLSYTNAIVVEEMNTTALDRKEVLDSFKCTSSQYCLRYCFNYPKKSTSIDCQGIFSYVTCTYDLKQDHLFDGSQSLCNTYVTTGVVGIVFGTLILIGVAAVAITATACFFIPGCMVYNQRKSYRPKVDYDKL